MPDVANYSKYLEKQSLAVLKRVCSMYPYECHTGKSLQSESAEVSQLMVRLLQEKADVAGARIISYELADLQYAPEIAPGMLVRQQAEALIQARQSASRRSCATWFTASASDHSLAVMDAQRSSTERYKS